MEFDGEEAQVRAAASVETVTIPELEAAPVIEPSRRAWTPREEAIVRQYVETRGCVAVGRYLERSADSIESKARRLGLSTPK